MFKDNPTAYDIYEFTHQLSNSPGTEYNYQEMSDFSSLALAEQTESGVDRSRSAIGFLINLNYLDFLSTPDSPSHHASIINFLMVEMLICLQKPKKILFAPLGYRALDINYPFSLENNVSEIHVINAPILDYVERFFNINISDENTVDMQDIQDGNFDSDYDLIVVYLENFCHSDEMLLGLVDHLSSGGSLLLMATSDLGAFYVHQEAHAYYHPHRILLERDDVTVFHLPIGLGYTLVNKK